jgi:hypothetical protein
LIQAPPLTGFELFNRALQAGHVPDGSVGVVLSTEQEVPRVTYDKTNNILDAPL